MRDFNHTVNVLVKAYLNNTLEHSNCAACAVGNMVAEAKGFKFKKNDMGSGPYSVKMMWEDGALSAWDDVFMTCRYGNKPKQDIDLSAYFGEAKDQIDSTGYSWGELAKIEYAFESAKRGRSEDDFMFNGLMAVVDVLADIHNIDMSVKEEAKALFVKV